jgi:hypothetical protein
MAGGQFKNEILYLAQTSVSDPDSVNPDPEIWLKSEFNRDPDAAHGF